MRVRLLKLKKMIVTAVLLCFFASDMTVHSQETRPQWWSDAWSLALVQAEYMSRSVSASGKLPRSTERGLCPPRDWTSGFFPGMLWYIYAHEGGEKWLGRARQATMLLHDEQYNSTDHDTGFRMYCSFGNGWLFTGDKHYKDVLVRSAHTLASRYSYKTGLIMSWEPDIERDWQFPVIIDNMMNLELLMEASKHASDTLLRRIALNHADRTMECQYRPDFSCPHVVDYDAETGEVRKYDWNNGSKNPETSVWSRGQSWGLYGFTMMFRETGDEKYLRHAENIAEFLLSHPNMPDDMVPYWDYSGPAISKVKDSSAAAIMASGLLELSTYSRNGERYFEAAEQILKSLSSPEYLAEPGENGDFILRHATGNCMYDSEMDGALIYGDYYFVESLLRYDNIIGHRNYLDYARN